MTHRLCRLKMSITFTTYYITTLTCCNYCSCACIVFLCPVLGGILFIVVSLLDMILIQCLQLMDVEDLCSLSK